MSTFILLNALLFESITSSLTWTESNNVVLPTPSYAMATGYDIDTNSIWLLGGVTTSLIRFDIDNNNLTIYPDISHEISAVTDATFTTDIIYIWSYEVTNFISTFNMKTQSFNATAISKPNPNIIYPCLIPHQNRYLFVLGGVPRSTSSSVDTFLIFDINTNQWINNGPSMIQPRRSLSCNIHNDILYAIAGTTTNNVLLNTVDIINIPSDITKLNESSWMRLSDTLSNALQNQASVVYDDSIYVIGGYRTVSGAYTNVVDIIDTKTYSISFDSYLAYILASSAVNIVQSIAGSKIYAFGMRDLFSFSFCFSVN